MSQYAQLERLPEILSALFLAGTLFSFGAIDAVTWNWFGTYTLTAEHASYIALGTFAVAFASSETNRFEAYEQWEQALIVASPAITLLWQYTDVLQGMLDGLGTPWMSVIPAVVVTGGWIVAVR